MEPHSPSAPSGTPSGWGRRRGGGGTSPHLPSKFSSSPGVTVPGAAVCRGDPSAPPFNNALVVGAPLRNQKHEGAGQRVPLPDGFPLCPCASSSFLPQFPHSGGLPSTDSAITPVPFGPSAPHPKSTRGLTCPWVQPVSPKPAQSVLGSHPHWPHPGPLCSPSQGCVPGERGWGGPGLIAGAGTGGHRPGGVPGALGRIKSSSPTAPSRLTRSSPAGELPEENIFQVRGYVTNISG